MPDDAYETERLYAMSYVGIEDDEEPVDAERVQQTTVGRVQHDVWRVDTVHGDSYWVVTNPTGSYDADKYDTWDALYMHIGVNVVLSLRDRGACPY